MSSPDKTLNKAILYVFIGVLIISSIFAVMMFGPRPAPRSDVFNTSLRFYEKGTEKLYYVDYADSIIQNIGDIGIAVTDYSMDYATFLDNVFGSKEYEMAIVELGGLNAPHLEFMFKEGASLTKSYEEILEEAAPEITRRIGLATKLDTKSVKKPSVEDRTVSDNGVI